MGFVIPATWEIEIRRITVQGQPGQKKVSEDPIPTNKLRVVVHTYKPRCRRCR
jgi:hypothetical protein